jgi:hypothetical protein
MDKVNRAARARFRKQDHEASRIEILKIRRQIIEAWKDGTIRDLCRLCASKGVCCEANAQGFLYGKGLRLPALETVRRIAELVKESEAKR